MGSRNFNNKPSTDKKLKFMKAWNKYASFQIKNIVIKKPYKVNTKVIKRDLICLSWTNATGLLFAKKNIKISQTLLIYGHMWLISIERMLFKGLLCI